MKTTLLATLAAAALFAAPVLANSPPPPPQPAATDVAPDIYVLSLYHTKIESESVSPEFGAAMTDSIILTSFTPDLLALYKQGIDAGHSEPVVDSDVLWGAQDWDVKEVATKTTAQDATTATVVVDFQDSGAARSVTLMLKTYAGGWQVDDIKSSDQSLREWLPAAIASVAKPQ